MMPVLARFFDPAPSPTQATPAEPIGLLFDVLNTIGHRAWMLPAIGLLSALVVLPTAGAYFSLIYRNVQRARRNHVLWPLLGLGFALLICTLLDEYLPEFGR